jgi:hypothetical protein
MADFCGIEDLEAFLQIDIADDSEAAARAIAEATDAIQGYCHQVIEEVEGDQVNFDVPAGCWRLFLPELPVAEVAEVVEDGETLGEGEDEDYQLDDRGVLYRVGGDWASGVQIVAVTYTHGHAEIPQTVVDVATRAAARAYQAGLRVAEVEGVPGVASVSLGDYSVSYAGESVGAGESVLGASAAPVLLRSEKEVLNRFRYVAP